MSQANVRGVPLIIVNGPDRDPALVAELRADSRLSLTTLEEADLAAAIRVGRTMVDSEWFAELDDDDFLLPGALSLRLRALEQSPGFDVVVTNGWNRAAGGDQAKISDITAVERDPLGAMLQRNWLLPGSWLCRTDAVGAEFFDGMPRFLECTYIGLRFASACRIKFLAEPTVVHHMNTPHAESRSREYRIGQAAALRRLLKIDLPPDVGNALRARLRRACHDNARLRLEEGSAGDAWSWHVQTLRERGGWRYLRHTAKFFYHRLTH